MKLKALLAQIAHSEDSSRQFKANVKNAESLSSEMAVSSIPMDEAIFMTVADDGSVPGLSWQDIACINQLINNVAGQRVHHRAHPPAERQAIGQVAQALGQEWQRVQETWLHTLGNLTLAGYNTEYSDRPFSEKRDMKGGGKESPLRLNEGLGGLDTWDEAAI